MCIHLSADRQGDLSALFLELRNEGRSNGKFTTNVLLGFNTRDLHLGQAFQIDLSATDPTLSLLVSSDSFLGGSLFPHTFDKVLPFSILFITMGEK